MDQQEREGNTLSHEFMIRVFELMAGVGTVVAMYYQEHPSEFRLAMAKAARSAGTFCQNQSVFWIRTAKGFLDLSDRIKL